MSDSGIEPGPSSVTTESAGTSRRGLVTRGGVIAAALAGGAAAAVLLAERAGLLPGSSGTRIMVNGRQHVVQAAPDTPLLHVLRDELHLRGPRFGCGLGQCGACTVHVSGAAVRSCSYPLSKLGDRPVTTLEGLGTAAHPHPLQRAFIEEQALQCGYCTNGMIMQAAAFLQRTPRPTDAQIRSALAANLCRCGSHLAVLRAVKRAAGVA